MAIITASILDADFARLEHEVTRAAAAGVDAFSLDVMDDHFVPRLTFDVVERIRAEERSARMALRLDTPIEQIPDDLLAAADLVNHVAVPLGYGGRRRVAALACGDSWWRASFHRIAA